METENRGTRFQDRMDEAFTEWKQAYSNYREAVESNKDALNFAERWNMEHAKRKILNISQTAFQEMDKAERKMARLQEKYDSNDKDIDFRKEEG